MGGSSAQSPLGYGHNSSWVGYAFVCSAAPGGLCASTSSGLYAFVTRRPRASAAPGETCARTFPCALLAFDRGPVSEVHLRIRGATAGEL